MTEALDRPRGRRWARVALAVALVVGTAAGVLGTSVLALVLGAPRLLTTGLEPVPHGALAAWLVSPDVAGTATRVLLWLLGAATLALGAALVTSRRWVWRAYAVWAIAGAVLAAYALVANWSLAPEAGLIALVVGGGWSAVIALLLGRVAPRTRTAGAAASR